jgi:hypothetical protein
MNIKVELVKKKRGGAAEGAPIAFTVNVCRFTDVDTGVFFDVEEGFDKIKKQVDFWDKFLCGQLQEDDKYTHIKAKKTKNVKQLELFEEE